MGKTIEDLNLREEIVGKLAYDFGESESDYINNDIIQDITIKAIHAYCPEFYSYDEAKEIEELIECDYFVRNDDPHFMIADGEVHWYSLIDGELFKDSSFVIKDWNLTQEKARELMLKHGFKEIKKEGC